jgi:hypothetical protein
MLFVHAICCNLSGLLFEFMLYLLFLEFHSTSG